MSQTLKLEDFDRRLHAAKPDPDYGPDRGSILQPWVTKLPMRAQGTMLTALRNADTAPKEPFDSPERVLVGAIRYACLVPASPDEVDNPEGGFFYSEPPKVFDVADFGHYPVHWFAHVVEASEVIAHAHPDPDFAARFLQVYEQLADSMHLLIEDEDAFWERIEAREKEDQGAEFQTGV